jgi:hypothetical protein
MFRLKLARVVVLLFGASAFACSDRSPVAPQPQATVALQPATIQAQVVAGTYLLSFRPTSSGLGVVLAGYVAELVSGAPAESGTATFQFCALGSTPRPSADCDSGSGHWVRWGSAGIIPSPSTDVGFALMTYDLVPTPGTTIGFRFRYNGKSRGASSGIANGVSPSADHTF